ncbi:hypothetical protein ACPA0F_18450 [Solibacillus silvestris]
MNKGDNVFIRPTTSLRFAGRWGVIEEVLYDEGLPYKVSFKSEDLTYGFFADELMDEQTFFAWLEVGSKVLVRVNGEVGKLTSKSFPHLYLDVRENPVHFSNVLPITYCNSCLMQMVAAFSNECIDCQLGGEIHGKE